MIYKVLNIKEFFAYYLNFQLTLQCKGLTLPLALTKLLSRLVDIAGEARAKLGVSIDPPNVESASERVFIVVT